MTLPLRAERGGGRRGRSRVGRAALHGADEAPASTQRQHSAAAGDAPRTTLLHGRLTAARCSLVSTHRASTQPAHSQHERGRRPVLWTTAVQQAVMLCVAPPRVSCHALRWRVRARSWLETDSLGGHV